MTEISSTTFKANTVTLYADNTTGNIGAGDLRAQMNDLADSVPFTSTGYTAAPTVSDDDSNTAGNGVFQISDLWIDETNNKAYMCVDNSTGAAIWVDITFIDPSPLSATAVPVAQELAVWVDGTTLQGFPELTWDDVGGDMTLTGNLIVSGTVDGRDISVDGLKLDGIPSNAISEVSFSNENVGGGDTGFSASTLRIITGDGLEVSNPISGVAVLEIRNNDLTKDSVDRTMGPSDNFAFITNEGASGTVTWTLPITSVLYSAPRLVTTFFKVANQTMQIKGANTVTINGLTETGSNESLIEICPTPYDTFAVVIYGDNANTYFVYQGTDINKVATTANTELAFWTGDGTIDGAPELTWDGTTFDVGAKFKADWAFNAQTGTTYTLALTDRSKIITMNNGAANTLTIPDSTTVNFPVGTEIRVLQLGAGTTTISGSAVGSGVTIDGILTGSGAITAQWDEVRLYKVSTDAWYAVGEIGAVT